MIEAFLLKQGLLGLKNWIWIALVAVIVAASATVIKIADNAVEDTLDTAKQAGASDAVAKGHETTLKQTEQANEAGNQVRDDRGGARYDECVRSASDATRGNCERYRQD